MDTEAMRSNRSAAARARGLHPRLPSGTEGFARFSVIVIVRFETPITNQKIWHRDTARPHGC